MILQPTDYYCSSRIRQEIEVLIVIPKPTTTTTMAWGDKTTFALKIIIGIQALFFRSYHLIIMSDLAGGRTSSFSHFLMGVAVVLGRGQHSNLSNN